MVTFQIIMQISLSDVSVVAYMGSDLVDYSSFECTLIHFNSGEVIYIRFLYGISYYNNYI